MFNGWNEISIAILVGSLLLLIAVVAFNLIRTLRANAKPGFRAALDALQPFVLRAIYAGETIALDGLKQLDAKLTGADKAAIANAIYDALPDTLWVGPVPIPTQLVKYWVPREHFAKLVEDEFQATSAFLARNEAFLKGQVDKLALPVLIPGAQG